jgi:hypothetical protein
LTHAEWLEAVQHLFWKKSTTIGGIIYTGNIEIGGGVKVGNTTAICSSANKGTIIYIDGCMQYCNETEWKKMNCTETRIVSCTGKPDNAIWNTATSITQIGNGSNWTPSNVGIYNITASTTECRFTCPGGTLWNGTNCIPIIGTITQCKLNSDCSNGKTCIGYQPAQSE